MILLLIIIFIILFLYFKFKFPKEVNILLLKLKKLIFGKNKKKKKKKNKLNNKSNVSYNKIENLNIENARTELQKLINKNEENNLEQRNKQEDSNDTYKLSRPPSPTATEVFRLDSNDLLSHAMNLE